MGTAKEGLAMALLRAFAVWLLIIAAETVHGVLRGCQAGCGRLGGTFAMPGYQKPLVAVVDDDNYKLALARHYLTYMGCDAQVFESGLSFLANDSREAACVIMNEEMPGLNGLETFHRMRRDGWFIPVISEGATFNSEEEALEAYRGGQVAHLMCPCRSFEFEDAVRKGLRAAGYCLPPKGVVTLGRDLLTWNGGTVPKLAWAISEGGAFQDLPVLGDALEEAGCTNADVLNHCRQPGEHWRGCWVLDRVHALLLPGTRFDVVECRGCKRRLRVPNDLGELTVRCPRCKHCFDWSRGLSLLFVG
jgi:CheY-like chemotaxis protein